MKTAISNIAWLASEDHAVYQLMHRFSCYGIEIAPSRIWPDPSQVRLEDVLSFKDDSTKQGLQIVAMQSLLFGHPELSIFESEISNRATITYLKKIIDLASALDSRSIVFGSPKNRVIGNLSRNESAIIARQTFKELGDYAATKKVAFCLEPNPKQYGTNFLNTTLEAIEFIQSVQSPGLWLNIDTGAMELNKESVSETLTAAIPFARHLHLSAPFLNEINNIAFLTEVINITRQLNYQHWFSIELKSGIHPSNIDTIRSVFDLLAPLNHDVSSK